MTGLIDLVEVTPVWFARRSIHLQLFLFFLDVLLEREFHRKGTNIAFDQDHVSCIHNKKSRAKCKGSHVNENRGNDWSKPQCHLLSKVPVTSTLAAM